MIRIYKTKDVNEINIRFYVIIRVGEALVTIVVIFLFEIIIIIFLCIIDILL